MKTCITIALVLCSALAFAQAGNPDEKAIRDIDKQWSAAVMKKHVDGAMAPYADDATMFPPGSPAATGKQKIRAVWQQFLSDPNVVSVNFGPNKVEVSKSGDMAYDTGWTEEKMKDAQGKVTTARGKYVVVWKKVGGKWQAVADIFNEDK